MDGKSSDAIYQTILLLIQRMKNSSLELVGKQLQTKRKGKQISKKIKRNSFGMSPLSEKIPKSLTNHIKDTVALGITQNLKKSVLPVDKKGIFNISALTEETETTVNSDRI